MATQAQLIQAVKDAQASGWTVTRTSSGYRATRTSEHPTPETIPEAWWGAPTYTDIRHLSIVVIGAKVTAAFTQHRRYPWVGAHEVKASFKAAIAFLADGATGDTEAAAA
ncbi:hypothetical protein [Kitasatospora purpeofusca]|uniref:hypothetical protein n=1 Tax=Kitasatospora purpeofusca TaxID=67352 RepID=UPI003696852F